MTVPIRPAPRAPVLTPATAARQAAAVARGQRFALLAAAAFTLAFGGMGAGFALGRRSLVTERAIVEASTKAEVAMFLRTLSPRAQLEFHAASLRGLPAAGVLEVAMPRFTPVRLGGQPAPKGVLDLTLVAADDSVWQTLPRRDREILLGGFVVQHQQFLGLIGMDSTRFAVVLFSHPHGQPRGRLRQLAARDRSGQLFVQ